MRRLKRVAIVGVGLVGGSFALALRRAGVVATQRPMSSSTRSNVSALSQIVPADQACSFDLV